MRSDAMRRHKGFNVSIFFYIASKTHLLFFLLGNRPGVNLLSPAEKNLLDLALLLKVPETSASQTTADLELLNNRRDGDKLHFGDLCLEAFKLLLREKDLIVDLIPGLSL
mmetsp:Transcript_23904/g.35659  ORF Transcript_23904/g.35659 Transcript_23904/m.35659 type:complete len:110 (+) Transcript_23904:266-595(+)